MRSAALAALPALCTALSPPAKCDTLTDCAGCIAGRYSLCNWCSATGKCMETVDIEVKCKPRDECVGHLPHCKHNCTAPGPTPPTPPAPVPPTPPTPSEKYSCVGGSCVVSTVGGVPKAECDKKCGAPKPPAPTPPAPPQPPAPTPPTPPAPTPPTPPAPTPRAPASGGPQAGQLYCGSVGGGIILKTNLTIHPGSVIEYHNHITIASVIVACPSEKFAWQPGVGCDPTVKGKAGCGTMDFSKVLSDPNDCLTKAGADEGGATHDFVYNGDEAKSIDSKDSKYGTVTMTLSTKSSC